MEPKKNPKADVGKKSMLFFQIGLVLMLLISWQAIEWKTYDKNQASFAQLDLGDEIIEEIPITQERLLPTARQRPG